MFRWVAGMVAKIGGAGWLMGGLAVAAAAYVGGSQIVLHNRQKALEAATEKIGALQGTIDTLTDINDQNLDQLEALRAQRARDERDLRAALDRAEKVRRTLVVVRMENARDPDASRPLADACPILDRYFGRMRAVAGADGRGADRAGSGVAARLAADLPGSARAAPARPGRAGGIGLD